MNSPGSMEEIDCVKPIRYLIIKIYFKKKSLILIDTLFQTIPQCTSTPSCFSAYNPVEELFEDKVLMT